MGPFYLIYHPERCRYNNGKLTIYHDSFGGNEDPYIWNEKFLHTYCHITQLSNYKNQVNFWVSGKPSLNDFTELNCDCVFHIAEKIFWKDNNKISRNDYIVDNEQTFQHHYKWVHNHPFKKRKRYTLKAEPDTSFQPQDAKDNLLDILPFLNKNGLQTDFLIKAFKAGVGSKPHKLDENIGKKLYDFLFSCAKVKLYGKDLTKKHPNRINALSNKSTNCC
ncbi:MAG: hypothetical protein KGZ85_15480 [Ignavibacterium sp.]|nr:hypothetical protein [Ignavibacterium sp.]